MSEEPGTYKLLSGPGAPHRISTDNKADSVFDFINRYREINDYMTPTLREIVEGVNLSSTSVAAFYLKNLERRGKIHRIPAVARGIRVVRRINAT